MLRETCILLICYIFVINGHLLGYTKKNRDFYLTDFLLLNQEKPKNSLQLQSVVITFGVENWLFLVKPSLLYDLQTTEDAFSIALTIRPVA